MSLLYCVMLSRIFLVQQHFFHQLATYPANRDSNGHDETNRHGNSQLQTMLTQRKFYKH